MSSAANADRNLLFGMFALQNDHLTQGQLIEAFQAWILRKETPLHAIIRDKGWMTAEKIDSLNAVLDRRAAEAGGQRQLLEVMPDEQCVLHTLTQLIRDDDILGATVAVADYYTRSIRPETLSGISSVNFFRDTERSSGRTETGMPETAENLRNWDQDRSRRADTDIASDTEIGLHSDEADRSPLDRTDFDVPRQPDARIPADRTEVDPTFVGEPTGATNPRGFGDSFETRVRFETEFAFNDPEDYLGSGAFGAVYRSSDREFQRQVALKRLKADHSSRSLTAATFLLEAEINGKLDHPGVLPMYGLGKTPEGVPFYVMKMIEAPDFALLIRQFHEAEARPGRDPGHSNRDFRRLLEHLRSVCMTMQYAHDRGVLHCDLKPANIMTGSYGETYVVDWGMALLFDPAADRNQTSEHDFTKHPLGEVHPSRREALHESQGGLRSYIGGTLAYMAPEHRSAHEKGEIEPMTPACDVFALGVMLYQILIGKLPFVAVEGEDRLKIDARIRSADYVAPNALKAGIPKAISAICMKALAASPQDRYGSAKSLAEDLEKWLADEPVTAYRENLAERSRRWARRNRTAVSAIAAALVVGVLSSLGYAIQSGRYSRNLEAKNQEITTANLRITDERNRAEANARLAQAREKMAIDAVKQYSDAVSKNAQLKNRPELDELRKELLKSPIEFFRKLRDEMQASKDTRPESLLALAEGLGQLANLTKEIGDRTDAKASYAQSAQIYDELVKTGPAETLYRSGLAGALNNLGTLERETGRIGESRSALSRAIETYDALVRTNPSDTENRDGLARALFNIGVLERAAGKPAEARAAYVRGIEVLEGLVKSDPTIPKFRNTLAAGLTNLGILQSATGNIDDARAAYARAVRLREELVKQNPDANEFRSGLASSLNNLGYLESETGKAEAARGAYVRAIETYEELIKANPTVTQFQEGMARVLIDLAIFEFTSGKADAAIKLQTRVISTYEKLVQTNPKVAEFRNGLASAFINLGIMQSETGKSGEARKAYTQGIGTLEELIKANPTVIQFRSSLARALISLGSLESENGKIEDARSAYTRAIRFCEELVQANPTVTDFRVDLAGTLNNLGSLESDNGRSEAARTAYERAIVINRELIKANPNVLSFRSELARVLNSLGNLELVTGKNEEAQAAYTQAFRIREELAQANPMVATYRNDLASTLKNMGKVSSKIGKTDDARREFARAIETYERLIAADRTTTNYLSGLGETLLDLGNLEQGIGNFQGARTAFEGAIRTFDSLTKVDPAVPEFVRNYGNSLNSFARLLVAEPGRNPVDYAHAMELAESALKTNPENPGILNSLGIAQYRTSKYAEAAETLTRSAELNRKTRGVEQASDLAFLAMAKWQLGQRNEAEETYARLAENTKRPEFAKDSETRQFFREASNLMYPMTLPEDPFQK